MGFCPDSKPREVNYNVQTIWNPYCEPWAIDVLTLTPEMEVDMIMLMQTPT